MLPHPLYNATLDPKLKKRVEEQRIFCFEEVLLFVLWALRGVIKILPEWNNQVIRSRKTPLPGHYLEQLQKSVSQFLIIQLVGIALVLSIYPYKNVWMCLPEISRDVIRNSNGASPETCLTVPVLNCRSTSKKFLRSGDIHTTAQCQAAIYHGFNWNCARASP